MGVYASVSGSFLFKSASVGQALMDLTKREIESTFRIEDFMIPKQECAVINQKKLSLQGVLYAIDKGRMGVVFVEEENKLLGIISNADIRKGLLEVINDLNKLNVSDIMNRNPIKISASSNVNELLELVRTVDFPVLYLPVVAENNTLVGAVTFLDLVKGE